MWKIVGDMSTYPLIGIIEVDPSLEGKKRVNLKWKHAVRSSFSLLSTFPFLRESYHSSRSISSESSSELINVILDDFTV